MENRKNIKTLTFPQLEPWQFDVVKILDKIGPEGNSFITVRSRRQCGKSFLINGLLLRTAINYPNTNSCCVSLTYKNTSKLFKELCDGLEEFEYVSYINKANMEIEFKNKSTITYRSASQGSALRGYSLHKNSLLCIDEGAFIKEETWGEILPWTQANKCNTLVVSTPLLRQGQYYQFFKSGIDNVPGFYSVDWNNYDTSKYLTNERIEMYRKILPPSTFKSEVLGEFVDDLGGVFDLSKQVFITTETPSNDIFIGIDWAVGNSGDYTCVSAFDNYGIQCGLDYTNGLSPTEQINWISNIIHSKYANKKILNIVAETNSIGAVYIADLKKAIGTNYNITEFTTTNSSKREIIEYMIKRVNESTVKFINNSEFYAELSSYMMEITKSGQITYNGYSQHDDMIMASAFALYAIKQLEANNNYRIKFINKRNNKKIYEKYS